MLSPRSRAVAVGYLLELRARLGLEPLLKWLNHMVAKFVLAVGGNLRFSPREYLCHNMVASFFPQEERSKTPVRKLQGPFMAASGDTSAAFS